MKEDNYNINDLEKLTGIKAHTIRIWEKRYNLLEPERTESNIRYYTANDLKRLLNISILNKNGLKISRISELKPDEISEKVIELTTRSGDVEDQVQALIMAMFHFNLPRFEKLLTVLALHLSIYRYCRPRPYASGLNSKRH
jgi:DNA-binding transcriptional MerR regulator